VPGQVSVSNRADANFGEPCRCCCSSGKVKHRALDESHTGRTLRADRPCCSSSTGITLRTLRASSSRRTCVRLRSLWRQNKRGSAPNLNVVGCFFTGCFCVRREAHFLLAIGCSDFEDLALIAAGYSFLRKPSVEVRENLCKGDDWRSSALRLRGASGGRISGIVPDFSITLFPD
jgi:hypothetical protein